MAARFPEMLPVSEGPLPQSAKHLLDHSRTFLHPGKSEWLLMLRKPRVFHSILCLFSTSIWHRNNLRCRASMAGCDGLRNRDRVQRRSRSRGMDRRCESSSEPRNCA
jgi:hypothetical protein